MSAGRVPKFDAEALRRELTYDPVTGVFTRLISRSNTVAVGEAAGSVDDMGYVRINLLGGRYRAHQLAWLYMTGEWPQTDIDHINGRRDCNQWVNLRAVSRTVNLQNRRAANPLNKTSGLLGASWSEQAQKWWSYIRVDGKTRHLGLYSTAEEAHSAYLVAKRALHEGCTI